MNPSHSKPTLSDLQALYRTIEIKEKHDELNSLEHLTGRNVKIPVNSKAFFEGTLEPNRWKLQEDQLNIESAYKSNESVNDCIFMEEEQVLVNLGQGYMVDMSRREACEYIRKKMDILQPSVSKDQVVKNVKSGSLKGSKTKKLQMKKGFLNVANKNKSKEKHQDRSNNSVSNIISNKATKALGMDNKEYHQNDMITSSSNNKFLPFMEIREEFDKDGNEIKSEALNVSKELVNFQRELSLKKKNKNDEDERNEIVDTLLEHLPQNIEDNDEADEDTIAPEEEIKPKQRDYSEVTARLDELILLEAEYEKKKMANNRSSKRLQGKGWAKGFFDQKPEKSRINQKKMSHSKETHEVKDTPIKNTKEKKVQFKPSNEVKEIPRIGSRSISEVTMNRVQVEDSDVVKDMQESILGTTLNRVQVADSNVSKDVQMVERNIPNVTKSHPRERVSIGGVMERPRHANTNTNSTTSNDTSIRGDIPQKKLSRFAQGRQQQR